MLTGQALIDDINACVTPRGTGAFWWLGQLGFVIKLGRTVCWIDAYLSPKAKRRVAPLVELSMVTNADIICGTHDHSDHIDRPAWPALAASSPEAQFVVPEIHRDRLATELGIAPQRVRGVDLGVSVTVGDITISGVPAAHEILAPHDGKHAFVGMVLEGNGVCVYHSGDTCIYEGMQAMLRAWHFDLAIVPINGRDGPRLARGCLGNMTFQEAVDLAGTLKPGLTVPGHWDMFADNAEDPHKFVDYLTVKYPGVKYLVPRHGERVVFTAGQRLPR